MKLIVAKRDTISPARKRCLQKFLHYFRKGFRDEKYIAWERQYKYDAHIQFQQNLNQKAFKELLAGEEFERIAQIGF